MKAVITKKNLLDGVRTAAHAISGRTALPILSHLLISAQDDAIKLSATDHQIGISTNVPAQILEPGDCTMPASISADVISALPEADVIIESNDNFQARILCPPAEYQILGLPPNEFPGLPVVPDDVWFEIDNKELKAGLKRTHFACSSDELRTILLGVLFSFSGDSLKLAATDTVRLAVDTRLVPSGEGEADAVIPSRAINELLRVLPDEGRVRVNISERQVQFTSGQITLTATLIEGQFPNYERVIPAEYEKKIVLPTALFLPAVRRASIVARADMNRIVVKTSGEKVIVSAKAGSIGEAREEVEAVREGDDITVGFNAEYLLDVLDAVNAEGVQIELTQPVSPSVIRPVGEDEYLCVVMPMQVSEPGIGITG